MSKKIILICLIHFIFYPALPVLSQTETLMTIGTNFWDQEWGGADPWENSYQNAVKPDSIEAPGYNPWKKQFLDEISIYSVFRFMDFGRINNNHGEVNWEDRVKKTDLNQVRMSLYWMIDLCNRTNTDLWYCLPERTVENYWENAAQLIKDNLNSDLKVYVEWSNETWNPQFSAYQTGVDSGKIYNLWFPGDQGESWGEQRLSARYTTFVSVRIWEKFADVFGPDFEDRVIMAFAGSVANNWWDAALFNALSDTVINPNSLLPDAFAIAPYTGGGLDGLDPDILNKMTVSMIQTEDGLKKVRAELDGAGEWVSQMPPHSGLKGLNIICYEAGQHIVKSSAGFAVNPDSYIWYTNYFNMLKKYIKGPVAHYTHSGSWGDMAWGAKKNIGQYAGESPKFIAINNWHILNVREDPGEPFSLTVTNGAGSGVFNDNMFAFIAANENTEGLVFDRWDGDTLFATDIRKEKTTVLIRGQNISLTALYKEPEPTTRFEAEDAELTGVEISSERGGFSGSGYINGGTFDQEGDKIEFTVNVEETGKFKLKIGYGGFFGDKYQYIHVNGVQIAYYPFSATNDWVTMEYGMVDLNAGDNTIAIVKAWGWSDIDFIEIEGEGLVSIRNNADHHIKESRLYNNYPNPFNPATVIKYFIPKSGFVSIDIFNIAGQLVQNLVYARRYSGMHSVNWDISGQSIASGIYIYRLKIDGFQVAKRMLVIK